MNTRRGACPALFTPMQTGDGLLVRIVPADAITPTAFVQFCEAQLNLTVARPSLK